MKHKFREQCAWCHKWTDDYDTSTGDIVCKKCISKNNGNVETSVINELHKCMKQQNDSIREKEPEQLDMEYFLSGFQTSD